MSKKHKKVGTTLNYWRHFLFQVLQLLNVLPFPPLLLWSVFQQEFKSVIKKKRKKHDKIVLLVNSNLNNIKFLIYKALIDSVISRGEFVVTENVLKEYNEIKKEKKIKYLVYKRLQSVYKTVLSYCCLKFRKNTESENPKVARTKNGRIMLLSNCVICDSKKSKFFKQQEVSGLLCSLGIKTPLNKIPLLGPLLC